VPLLMPTAIYSLSLSMGALLEVFSGIVMVLFTICALLLTVVILLQEGKGGGLAGAFGGAGADAFGVKAGTVNKFTAWLGAAFLGLALLFAGMQRAGSPDSITGPEPDVTKYDETALPGPEDASEDGAAADEGAEGSSDDTSDPDGD
jgi:preprotein translocase subunit SecG